MKTITEKSLFNKAPLEDTVYERMAEYIHTASPNQALAPGVRLAEMFGVSHSTIRRVMQRFSDEGLVRMVRGRGTFVTPVEERDQKKLIGDSIIFADSWDEGGSAFYARQLQGMMEQAEVFGLRLQTLRIGEGSGDSNRLYEELARPGVVGVMIPWAADSIVEKIRAANPKAAIVDIAHRFPPANIPCIRIDHYAFGAAAYRWLTQKGCKRIASVSGYADTPAGIAATRTKTDDPEVLDISGAAYFKHHTPKVAAICDALMAAEFDGVVFDEDHTAMTVLWELAKRAPDIFSGKQVVSHANAGENLLPAEVTCFEFDGHQVGRMAVAALKNQIDGVSLGGVALLVGPTLRVAQETE